MTNGEKLEEMFPGIEWDVFGEGDLEYIQTDLDATIFSSSWWFAEYKGVQNGSEQDIYTNVVKAK